MLALIRPVEPRHGCHALPHTQMDPLDPHRIRWTHILRWIQRIHIGSARSTYSDGSTLWIPQSCTYVLMYAFAVVPHGKTKIYIYMTTFYVLVFTHALRGLLTFSGSCSLKQPQLDDERNAMHPTHTPFILLSKK